MTSSRTAVLSILFFLAAAACDNQPRRADDETKLIVAMSTFSESTFLPWNGSTGRKLYLDTIYDYLTYIDPATNDLIPGLAERWQVSPDGMTHTLWIRPGIQFHESWGELTAEDAKYTLERMIEPEAIAGPSSPLRKLIENVDAPERYRLEIHLTSPDIHFTRAYLSNGLIVPIVSKRYLETVGDNAANKHPIGTGAYSLAGFKKDVNINLRLREDQDKLWRANPDFPEIIFLSVPEEFTRVAMLKTGEIDLAPINFDSIDVLEDSGMQVLYVPGNWAPVIRLGGLVPLFPNPEVPWADLRVRQALNYAIDKETIVKAIFKNQALIVGADFPSRDFYDIPPYPYDPDKARQLLREAGYGEGFTIKIKTYTTNPGAELPIIAEIVALYWDAIGLQTVIEPTNWVSLRGSWSTGKATDISWTHRGLAFTTTLAGLQSSVMTASVFSSFANSETDDYIRRISHSLVPEERKQVVRELGVYLREQAAAVYIAFVDEPFGASNKIGHWPALSEQGTNIDLITRSGQ